MRRLTALLVAVAILACVPARAQEEEPPYPRGSSSQRFADLKFQLVLPDDYDPQQEYSLIVILHGAGGTETGMAGALQALASRGFVVCAPKSTAETWNDADVRRVKEITQHLMDVLSVGKGRLHGAGFSNGGWNLAPLVFDESLPFVSACWIAAGYNGGKIPKRAAQEMGVLALAGAQDPNRASAEKTVDLVEKKVRTAECQIQDGIGHEFPDKLMPYYFFWLESMEGRFTPGVDQSFDWAEDPDQARERMASERKGGFFYFYSAEDVELPESKFVHTVIFFDPLVRRFGRQLLPVKLDRAEHEELFASLKLKKTPALVVLKPSFKVLKSFAGRIHPGRLAAALRALSPDPSLPK